MSEYKSPIKVTFEDISSEVINRYDNEIIYRVKKITGINVDKKRLINALLLDKKLVRCKDCKYWADGTCEMLGTVHMNADDFCSRGEER